MSLPAPVPAPPRRLGPPAAVPSSPIVTSNSMQPSSADLASVMFTTSVGVMPDGMSRETEGGPVARARRCRAAARWRVCRAEMGVRDARTWVRDRDCCVRARRDGALVYSADVKIDHGARDRDAEEPCLHTDPAARDGHVGRGVQRERDGLSRLRWVGLELQVSRVELQRGARRLMRGGAQRGACGRAL